MKIDWSKFGLSIPIIMLPKKGTDMYKWPVVACDQYTSERWYWEQVETLVGEKDSTLKLMLPEIYLETEEEEKRVKEIRANMEDYRERVLESRNPGCVLVEREVEGKTRLGLVICVDLECYNYEKGSSSIIRATEGTVTSRIPPRLRIRRGASLEMPHILLLFDDPKKKILEPLKKLSGEPVYDTPLMMNGGHLTGKWIREEDLGTFYRGLEELYKECEAGYGKGKELLFAVGDGNHSLATAKANWEEVKKCIPKEEQRNHPARFALCEIENIHDEGIVFEPIHRVVFGKKQEDGQDILKKLVAILNRQNGTAKLVGAGVEPKIRECIIPFCTGKEKGSILVQDPTVMLEVEVLQNALDELIQRKDVNLDYIHGEKTVETLAKDSKNVGLFLPAMDKFKLFPAVARAGALPRKTFSMGEANEKRYYMEVRSLEPKQHDSNEK